MKKTVFTYGGIAGLIVTIMMIISTSMHYQNPDYKWSEIIGFTGMFIAFIFVFLGIKNYRDKQNNGIITFGTAFKIGLLITLISSTLYVITWMIEYHYFFPDFIEKYAIHAIEEAQKSGASTTYLAETQEKMNTYKEWYKSPILMILLTYMEILPIGLIITLISSLILKKK